MHNTTFNGFTFVESLSTDCRINSIDINSAEYKQSAIKLKEEIVKLKHQIQNSDASYLTKNLFLYKANQIPDYRFGNPGIFPMEINHNHKVEGPSILPKMPGLPDIPDWMRWGKKK